MELSKKLEECIKRHGKPLRAPIILPEDWACVIWNYIRKGDIKYIKEYIFCNRCDTEGDIFALELDDNHISKCCRRKMSESVLNRIKIILLLGEL